MRADRGEERTIPVASGAFDRPLLFSIAYLAPGGRTMKATPALEPLVRQGTILLTTYRRDGTPVGTPVHVAVEGDRAFVRTWDTTGKLKRIRRTPGVEVCPSTFGGRPTGAAIRARARILEGEESARAGRMLARKYPVLHGLLIPLVHCLRGDETIHIELSPAEEAEQAQ